MTYLSIIIKITFFYFFVALTYRIMGKREVGQLGVMDLIVSILIAELTALSIENDKSILYTLIPISFLVFMQIAVAYLSLKIPKLRSVFDGNPSLIINRGKLNFKEMITQRYNLDDLLLQLREKGIKSIEDVEYAILEKNGRLSAFTYKKHHQTSFFPVPLILDGHIQTMTLKALNKNERWLKKLLKVHGLNLEDVFYAFYKGERTFIIKKNDVAKGLKNTS